MPSSENPESVFDEFILGYYQQMVIYATPPALALPNNSFRHNKNYVRNKKIAAVIEAIFAYLFSTLAFFRIEHEHDEKHTRGQPDNRECNIPELKKRSL